VLFFLYKFTVAKANAGTPNQKKTDNLHKNGNMAGRRCILCTAVFNPLRVEIKRFQTLNSCH
jgi:hypothetical protein